MFFSSFFYRATTGITNFIKTHPYALTTLFCLSLLAMAEAQRIAELDEAEETDLTCFNWLNMVTSTCFNPYSDLTWRCLNNAAKYYGLSPGQMLACRNMAAEYQDHSELNRYDMENECFTHQGEFRLLRDEDGRYWNRTFAESIIMAGI